MDAKQVQQLGLGDMSIHRLLEVGRAASDGSCSLCVEQLEQWARVATDVIEQQANIIATQAEEIARLEQHAQTPGQAAAPAAPVAICIVSVPLGEHGC